MLRITIVFALLITSSCKTNTTNPFDIVNSKVITMTVEHVGCFGGATQVITIKENHGKRMLTNNCTKGKSEPERTIPFDIEKEKTLSDLIHLGTSISDSLFCTSQSFYKIETEKYSCVFQDNTCKLDDYLSKLLE